MDKNPRNKKHGLSKERVFKIWASMKARCNNKNIPGYKNYGGRGIKVCERWMKFENFFCDMGHPPKGFSIERIDVNKGYFLENCIWADRFTQASNKRTSKMVEINGVKLSLARWCREMELSYPLILNRIRSGWSLERAMTEDRHIDHIHTEKHNYI